MATTFYLTHVLQRVMADQHITSFYRLQEEIRQACNLKASRTGPSTGSQEPPPIHRHKLRDLIAPPKGKGSPKLILTTDELIALDCYLSKHGYALDQLPLLRHEGLLHDLAKKQIVFFLGARPRGGERPRHDVSIWDVRAYIHVLNQLSYLHLNADTRLCDVVGDPSKTGDAETTLRDAEEITLSSVCAIGSPRSLITADLLMERIFAADPSSSPNNQPNPMVPFKFCWALDSADGIRSRFRFSPDQLQDQPLSQKIRDNKAAVLRLHPDNPAKQHDLVLDMTKDEYHDYGLIVAQREENDRMRLVLAGLSGLGTYAAAQVLDKIEFAARGAMPRNHNHTSVKQIMYAVVEIPVSEARDREVIGDPRRPGVPRLINDYPTFWPSPA